MCPSLTLVSHTVRSKVKVVDTRSSEVLGRKNKEEILEVAHRLSLESNLPQRTVLVPRSHSH